ncbi:cytochrome P450 [Allokutzneria multivorans]|uniref:Cytochrome P450 n=1 Tax=Allokutzneria multivorans TaxID=1142134 RepID=A0ABP7U276_9PSEU
MTAASAAPSSPPAWPRVDYPFARDPHGGPPPVFDELRERWPVCPMRMPDGELVWLVTRYRDVATVLSDPRFSRALTCTGDAKLLRVGVFGDPANMFNMDAPDHTRLRRILAPVFAPGAVRGLRPFIERSIGALIEHLAQLTPPVDLMTQLAIPLPISVNCDLFGIAAKDWAEAAMLASGFNTTTTAPGDLRRQYRMLRALLERLVAEQRARPGTGVLSMMLAARDEEDRLSDDELLATAAVLLVGGTETVSSVVGLGVQALLNHPEQLAACTANPRLWKTAVEEVMRYRPGFDLSALRVTREPVELSGTVIPQGASVCAPVLAAAYDPAVFPDPHRFDIHRDNASPIHFGHGAHYCIGAGLSRLELEVTFSKLFERFPGLRLATSPERIPFQRGSAHMRPTRLMVTW